MPHSLRSLPARDSELFDACERGDAVVVKQLLRAGIDANATATRRGYLVTSLLGCVMQGSAECAKLLVDANADVNASCEPEQESPLIVSCSRGNTDCAKVCIDAGADVGATDSFGRSPLLHSCLNGRPECTALLLDAGADMEQHMTDHNPGATPLYAAALKGSTRCIALLCDAGANRPLRW